MIGKTVSHYKVIEKPGGILFRHESETFQLAAQAAYATSGKLHLKRLNLTSVKEDEVKSKDIGYSMPVVAPLYSEPPYLYRGGNSLLCIYRTKEETLREIVPEPLKPAEGNLVMAWINKFNAVGLGLYHEAIISTPVEFKGTVDNYMVYLYLDSDTPIMAGREIWGYPKKAAHFTLSQEAEVLTRSVTRGE